MQCQLFFIKNGYNVYLPVSENSRCDLIVNINNCLFQIQIKTSHITKNNTGIEFNTCSLRMNHNEGNIRVGYSEEDVDFFMTEYNNTFYLIPLEICGKSSKILSFKQAPNGAASLLEDYEALKIINNINDTSYYENKKGNRQIGQYDKKTLDFIQSYNSLGEAAKAIGKEPRNAVGHISDVARGKRKSAYGFVWKYIE